MAHIVRFQNLQNSSLYSASSLNIKRNVKVIYFTIYCLSISHRVFKTTTSEPSGPNHRLTGGTSR